MEEQDQSHQPAAVVVAEQQGQQAAMPDGGGEATVTAWRERTAGERQEAVRLLGQTGTHDLHPKLTILPDGSIVTKTEVASMLRQGYDLNDGPSSRI